jgi:hypothetical protein
MRVLGDRGHLSNAQAANLLREILQRSQPGLPQHVVQLHLSRQCNRPAMAADAARVVVQETGADVIIHTATQNSGCPTLVVGDETGPLLPVRVKRRIRKRTTVTASYTQPLLWETDE